MELKNLDFEKRTLAQQKMWDKEESKYIYEAKVTFCEQTFNIHSPNINQGVIDSNCRLFNNKDIHIINSLSQDYLNKLEEELLYLQKLATARKKELVDATKHLTLNIEHHKKNNNKLCTLRVFEYEVWSDIYGDTDYTTEIIEQHTFSDVKSNQKIIQNKIAELKEKYDFKEISEN